MDVDDRIFKTILDENVKLRRQVAKAQDQANAAIVLAVLALGIEVIAFAILTAPK